MYVPRAIEDRILEASRQFPAILVTGPRQVGKTTLLRHLADDRRYATLDDLALRALAREDPALFLQRFPPPVLIDEIQYAPDLLPYVKMAIDERTTNGDGDDAAGAFWLTGSQQFRLMKGVTESLAGRVAIVDLLGFSAREADRRPARLAPFLPTPEIVEERLERAAETSLGAVFERVWRGSFPALVAGPITDRDLFYSSYLQTYLERDVRDLAQVGNHEAFFRFLQACAARTGQLLNLSDLARDVDVAVTTAKSWLSILEASMQVALLRPIHRNVSLRLIKAPKLYFLDTGLASYLTEWSSPETLAAGAMAGPMLETWVFGELLKSYRHRLETPRIHFYRDKDGKEIDFVLTRDDTLYPLEVKLAATPKRAWAGHFHLLSKLGQTVGPGGVLCLVAEPLPLTRDATALPAGLL